MSPIVVVPGGYGPPLTAGRANPAQPPSPFNAFLVTTPAGSFAAPQGYPQQAYGTAAPFGQYPTPSSLHTHRHGVVWESNPVPHLGAEHPNPDTLFYTEVAACGLGGRSTRRSLV